MSLFYVANHRDSISFFRFPILCHIQIISYTIFYNQYFRALFVNSSRARIIGSTQSSVLTSSLPSFLDTQSQSMCIVINFLVLCFICQSSTFVYFKNGPEYMLRETTHVFIPLMIFLPQSLVLRCFLFFEGISFLLILFIFGAVHF